MSGSAQAQIVDATNLLDKFSQELASKCEPNVNEMLNKDNHQPVLKYRPINTKSICRCTNEILGNDKKLHSMFIGAKNEVEARLNDGTIGAYLTVRALQASFECMSIDLDKSLLAFTTPPPKSN